MDAGTATPDDVASAATGPGSGCPVAEFGRLREQGPVVDFPSFGGDSGVLITRHDDVRAVLTDPRLRADASTVDGALNALSDLLGKLGIPPELDWMKRSLLSLDGAEHTRLRKLVSRAFTVRRVNALRPRVETLTEDLLDDIAAVGAGGGSVDLVQAFAYPLPIAVICELVGVPEPDRPRWRELAELLTSPAPDRMPPVIHAVVDQIRVLVEARRNTPADDLMTVLVEVHDDGDRLTENEMITMMFELVIAGFETTAHLISKSVQVLLTRPDQLAVLRSEPGLWPRAVHELVRTCGPIPTSLPRYAATDIEFGGVTVPAGSTVTAGILTANFDPEFTEDPDELDVRRETGHGERHLGFGQGAHYCLGAALARQEAEVALRGVFERFPDLRLADPVTGPAPLGFARLPELPVLVASG
ncbi:cytochrome P450 family protein [Nocardia rhamnosiphila]